MFRKYVLEKPFVLHLFFMLSVLYYSFLFQITCFREIMYKAQEHRYHHILLFPVCLFSIAMPKARILGYYISFRIVMSFFLDGCGLGFFFALRCNNSLFWKHSATICSVLRRNWSLISVHIFKLHVLWFERNHSGTQTFESSSRSQLEDSSMWPVS